MRQYIDPVTKEVYYEYSFAYNFKDKEWSISVWATSPEEAKEKLNSTYYAKYDGQVMDVLEVKDGINLVDKVYMYIRALYIKLFA